MKFSFTLFFILSVFSIQSQPTLTTANEAAVGNSFIFEFADTAGIIEGPAGASQIWDFSWAIPAGIQHAESWVDPATTPYYIDYPTSTHVQLTSDDIGGFIYSYYTHSATQTALNGIVTTVTGAPVDMHFTNSQILRQYPATYNTTFQDSFAGMSIMTVGPLTSATYRNGSYQYLVDGYGTLITPIATYPNSLRVKITQSFMDSTIYIGVPLPPVFVFGVSTTYLWASADAGDKLYQFFIGYDTTLSQAGTTNFKNVSYQNDITGIPENGAFLKSAYIYPNPAMEWANIRIDNPENGEALLCLYNATGSLVKSCNITMKKNDFFEWRVSLEELPAGIYSIKISCKEQYWTTRIVKQ
jgi:hypothetical protein